MEARVFKKSSINNNHDYQNKVLFLTQTSHGWEILYTKLERKDNGNILIDFFKFKKQTC